MVRYYSLYTSCNISSIPFRIPSLTLGYDEYMITPMPIKSPWRLWLKSMVMKPQQASNYRDVKRNVKFPMDMIFKTENKLYQFMNYEVLVIHVDYPHKYFTEFVQIIFVIIDFNGTESIIFNHAHTHTYTHGNILTAHIHFLLCNPCVHQKRKQSYKT